MAGLEGAYAARIVSARASFQPFTYLEIGVAYGRTLATVADLLRAQGQGWRAVGVELPDGYSFNRDAVVRNCNELQLTVSFIAPKDWSRVDPIWNRVTVYLSDSHELMEKQWKAEINFALIDGCHGKPCAMKDFINVEPHVPKDGIIALHDCEKEFVGENQPHCNYIDVFGACEELGLHANTRKGWSAAEILAADRSQGGHDMLLVRRTE